MSTDDLTARARKRARLLGRLDVTQSAILSELADEVDRLRADSERYHAQYVEAVDTAAHAGHERDAARAAFERVRAVVETVGHHDDTGTYVDIEALTRALEGES